MASSQMHAMFDKSKFELQRFSKVTGDQEKGNDLILCRSERIGSVKKTVIYFGGDVQNYPEKMSQHRTNNLFLHWNLENTARILALRFPDSLIMVVKPKEMLLNTFSIYSNFVEFDQDGFPTLFTEKEALTHLSKLHAKALEVHFNKSSCDSDDKKEVCSESSNDRVSSNHTISCEDEHEVTIVGFSKGCVPLNQIMYEIAVASLSPETSAFASKIKAVYWLDPGHNGRKDIYLTDDSVLQNIVSTKIQLFVNVTPYQVKDPNRPWIGKEKKKFIHKLKSFHANLVEKEHHFDEPGSLDFHFAILTEF